MKQNHEKWWILESIPLLLLWVYVLSTLVMFRFGFIQWTVDHVTLVILYVISIYASFSIGYLLWLRHYKKKSPAPITRRTRRTLSKMVLWGFRIGALISIVHSCAWLNQIFGADFFRFMTCPGAAYDLSNFLGDLYASGVTPYPMWFRWVSRFNTLLGGFKIAAVCLGAYHLGRFRLFDKILFFVMAALDILYAWLFGKQSLFLIFVLEIIIALCAKFSVELYEKRFEKTLWQAIKEQWRSLFTYILSMALLLSGIVILIMIMQNDRVVQRNIRTDFYFEAVEKNGAPPSSDELEYFVLRSVMKRTGYSIKDSQLYDVVAQKYGDFFSSDEPLPSDKPSLPGTLAPGTPESPEKPEKPSRPETPATLNANFVGLSGFYKVIDHPMLPGAIRYGLQSVEMYVTQGYASMALAFDLDFQWSRFVGHSIYLSHLVDRLFGTTLSQQTYTARNEQINGWSESIYFNTLYTWLASDITFFGVLILFFFWGVLFSKIWMEIICEHLPFALPICYQFVYALVFAPTNNSLFNTLSELTKSGLIFVIYAAGLLFCKMYPKTRKSQPKKLLFVIGDLGVGGAAKMLVYTANISAEIFSDVTILVLKKHSEMHKVNPSIKIVELDLPFQKKGSFPQYFARYKALRQALRELSPDIIVAFVNPIILYSCFAKPANAQFIGADRGNPQALPRLHKVLSRFIYPRCDKLIFQTQSALNCFQKNVRKKSVVIENPFIPTGRDPGVFCGTRKKTIVSTSRLDPDKNIDVLIRAFAQSRAADEYVLQIFGNGPCRESLQRLVSELDLADKVLFMGEVSDTMCAIQDAGMFALVSKHEGMPNGLIEAMALGIPCITTNCMAGGTNTLIEHMKNGLIVKTNDVDDLTGAINLYCENVECRESLGSNSAKIRETLSEACSHEKWTGFFEELAEDI